MSAKEMVRLVVHRHFQGPTEHDKKNWKLAWFKSIRSGGESSDRATVVKGLAPAQQT